MSFTCFFAECPKKMQKGLVSWRHLICWDPRPLASVSADRGNSSVDRSISHNSLPLLYHHRIMEFQTKKVILCSLPIKNKTQSAYIYFHEILKLICLLLHGLLGWSRPAVLLLLRLDHDLNEKIFHPPGGTITWDPPKGKFGKSSTPKWFGMGYVIVPKRVSWQNKNGSIMASTHGRKLTFPMRSDGGNTMKWTASRKNQRIIFFLSQDTAPLIQSNNFAKAKMVWIRNVHIPYHPWMVYLPTFGCFLS